MPRLRDDHARALAAVRATAARNLPLEQLVRALLQPLERAIGWDGYRLFAVDPETLLINRLLGASDDDRSARLEWLQHIYLDDRTLPYLQLPALMRSGLRSAAFLPRQDQSWGYLPAMFQGVEPERHWEYYFESQNPVGGVLQTVFEANSRKVAILQVNRRDPGTYFSPHDVQLMRLAGPIVGPALSSALNRERAIAAIEADRPSGVLILGKDRSISLSTPAAEEWLDHLRAAERDTSQTLPTALWSVTRGFALEHMPLLRMSAETAKGSVMLEASSGGDGTIVVIVSAQASAPRQEPPLHWGLTAQQSQIVMQVIAGATNQEIAQRLYLSVNTVEWHLRKIFRSLDVSSRSQLQSRYFREVGLGSYAEPLGLTK